MKQALCIPKMDVMESLLRGEIQTVNTKLVPRDVCEVVENGYEQLIPYVIFSTNDIQEGRMKFIQYQRPDTGEGEARLQGKTSVGFGVISTTAMICLLTLSWLKMMAKKSS